MWTYNYYTHNDNMDFLHKCMAFFLPGSSASQLISFLLWLSARSSLPPHASSPVVVTPSSSGWSLNDLTTLYNFAYTSSFSLESYFRVSSASCQDTDWHSETFNWRNVVLQIYAWILGGSLDVDPRFQNYGI